MDFSPAIAFGLLSLFLVADVSPSNNCIKLDILGGTVTMRQMGRRARFSCRKPYRLFGPASSTCFRGRWSPGPPKCGIDCPITSVKMVNRSRLFVSSSVCERGYEAVPFITAHCEDETGLSSKSYPICIAEACAETYTFCNSNDCNVFAARNLNELYVSCKPGFSPLGRDKVDCDSQYGLTFAGCRGTPVQLSCDFELISEPYCGWGRPSGSDDAFLWFRKGRAQRRDLFVSRSLWETLPATDHTSEVKGGGGMSGSYLYLPTAYLKMGDRVRLFSPEYDLRSNESLSHCFTFWYHMKSRSVGELNIYINDELRWTIAGEQGSDWNEGFVPLPNDFVHIIVEATRGYAADSYIAIDDFAITNSQQAEDHECFAQDAEKINESAPTTPTNEMLNSDDDSVETTDPPANEPTPSVPFNNTASQKMSSKEVTTNSFSQDTTIPANVSVETMSSSSPPTPTFGTSGLPQGLFSRPSHEVSITLNTTIKEHSVVQTSPKKNINISSGTSLETFSSSHHEINVFSTAAHDVSHVPGWPQETSISSETPKITLPLVETVTSQSSLDSVSIKMGEFKPPDHSNTITEPSLVKNLSLLTDSPAKQTLSEMLTVSTSTLTSTFQTAVSAQYELADNKSAVVQKAVTISHAEISTSPQPKQSLSPEESLKTSIDYKNEIMPTKLLPDTLEGVHFNAHNIDRSKWAITSSNILPVTERGLASGFYPKDSAKTSENESIRGNSIEGSETVSDTHSLFDDALDPDSVDDTHYSDVVKLSSPDMHNGDKLFVSKPPSIGTIHVNFPNDLTNGMDEGDNSPAKSDCSSINCVRHDLNDEISKISESPISKATKNNALYKENHEGLKPEVSAEGSGADNSLIKGSQLTTTKINSKMHYFIVAATGIVLTLMIIAVVFVFRIAKKRMKRRQQSGILDDDFSINLQLANSKEILNFSLLQPDQL
nr:PREDICTED: uncharacterized protein LOC109030754 isoform X1 [Bemisia tabaci]